MDALAGLAVGAGDEAAGKSVIDDVVVSVRIGQDTSGPLAQILVSAGARRGAEIEDGEFAVEQARHTGSDGMGIEQNGDPEPLAQARQFFGQLVMIGAPVLTDASVHFIGVERRLETGYLWIDPAPTWTKPWR